MGNPSAFRSQYLSYDELTAQLQDWVTRYPDVVRLTSLTETPEGRQQWLITIGPEPDRVRPAVWVDGNMHASEVCGSSVALAIAEDMIRLHTEPSFDAHGMGAGGRATLKDVLFYVLPRMSPDGAECVLTTGRFVRSVPRDRRANKNHARWISEDMDGDGLALVMRKVDPTGEFVESPDFENLLVRRTLDDEGPFYKLYPEGRIENFDGHSVPKPDFIGDNEPDLNRNFPWSWEPEPDQVGSGDFPASEPESRSVVEFAVQHPHLFAWINLHTFGGVFIRPPGHQPDSKMDRSDLAIFRQIEAWGDEFTGYPTVSGFEEFLYEPEKPIRGDLSEFAYNNRGTIAYVVELWDLFEELGFKKPKRFVERYTQLGPEDMVKLAQWDRDKNGSQVVRPWKKVEHPQLGEVEVGGIDPRFGLWNPPVDRLEKICRDQSAMFLRVAAMAPKISVGLPRVTTLGDTVRVEVPVENHGYLPSNVLSSAMRLPFTEPLAVTIESDGPEVIEPRSHRSEIGHLRGWGRGMHSGEDALYYMRSDGTSGRAWVSIVARGTGTLTVSVHGCRVGTQTRIIEI